MAGREGPCMYTVRSCGLCKWHGMAMERSGLRPIYQHYCKHPAVKPERPDVTLYMLNVSGKHIGETDSTPNWCPVKATGREQEVE